MENVKIPCTVGMLTFNSAATIRRALESVKDFDEIIFCDGGSTDDTLLIAKEYGVQVIQQDIKYKYPDNSLADGGGTRNQMITAARNEWFLMIDSDESISQELHDDIARISRHEVRADDPLVYRVPIRMVVNGRVVRYSSNYPGYQTRFINIKSGGRFVRRAHNKMEFAPGTRIGTLPHPWFVYLLRADINLAKAERKHYRRVEIEEACDRPLPDFMRYVVWWHLRAAVGIALKSAYLYLRHGFSETMPLSAESARVLSPLILVVRSCACRMLRMIGWRATASARTML